MTLNHYIRAPNLSWMMILSTKSYCTLRSIKSKREIKQFNFFVWLHENIREHKKKSYYIVLVFFCSNDWCMISCANNDNNTDYSSLRT